MLIAYGGARRGPAGRDVGCGIGNGGWRDGGHRSHAPLREIRNAGKLTDIGCGNGCPGYTGTLANHLGPEQLRGSEDP